MRRIAFYLIGWRSISLIDFYNLSPDSPALPENPAACLSWQMNLDLDIHFTVAEAQLPTIKQALEVDTSEIAKSPSIFVELAAPDQFFYDMRIIQPVMPQQVILTRKSKLPSLLTILEQDKWSEDAKTADDDVRKWLGI
jgi:hypothetical protein